MNYSRLKLYLKNLFKKFSVNTKLFTWLVLILQNIRVKNFKTIKIDKNIYVINVNNEFDIICEFNNSAKIVVKREEK